MNPRPDLLPVVVLGEAHLVEGFVLAGATVIIAEDDDAVRRAWQRLPDDAVVVLSPAADRALPPDDLPDDGVHRLRVVIPA